MVFWFSCYGLWKEEVDRGVGQVFQKVTLAPSESTRDSVQPTTLSSPHLGISGLTGFCLPGIDIYQVEGKLNTFKESKSIAEPISKALLVSTMGESGICTAQRQDRQHPTYWQHC